MADSRARWEVVYGDIKSRIDRGDLQPGDTVPPELTLAGQYGFSRATVRTAITHLEQEGLVTSGAGRLGRTVQSRDLITFNLSRFELGAYADDPVNRVDQWEADAQSEGWNTRQVVAEVTELEAPSGIARYLRVGAGTRLVRRRRLRYVEKPGTPETLAMIADNWTPIDIAHRTVNGIAPLMETSNVVHHGGIYRALGLRQVKYEDEIQARMPTSEERGLLHTSVGTPVGQLARVGIDKSGRRVRVLVSVWAGDRQRVTYELEVPEQRYQEERA